MSEPRIIYPFWIKLLFYGLALSLIPTIVVGYKAITENAGLTKKDNLDFRLAIAEDMANSISLTLLESSNTLVAIAQNFGDSKTTYDEKEKIGRLFVESSDLLDHVLFYTKEGAFIDAIIQEKTTFETPKEKLNSSLFKRAEKNEVAFGETRGSPLRVFTLVPIRTDGKLSHFVGSYVPLTRIQNRISHLSDRITNFQGTVFIVDANLQYIAHPDEARSITREKAPTNDLLRNIKSAFKDGVAQSGEFIDSDGNEQIGSIKPLTIVPWAVVVEASKSDVYASYLGMRRMVIITILAAFLFAIFIALFFSKFLSASISKLVEYSKKLANREFDAELNITSRDEIGVLAGAMRDSARSLKASEATIKKEVAIRSDLGRYLPQAVVDGIVDRNFDLELGGGKENITVLFADVVSFTEVCQKNSPETVVAILNELFTILTEVIFRHHGTVDKFIGDCVMAFWGAPDPLENPAKAAIEAAEEMLRYVEIGSVRWKKEYGITIKLAIGIHSGEAIVGNIGSSTRMEYTAIGSTVNIAARLEALARPNQILTTAATQEAVGDAFSFIDHNMESISSGGSTVRVVEVSI